jgi:predicted flap endonuclease-1-like 5' DNA nuclease
MEVFRDNWPLILIAAAVVVVLLYLLLRPRQRVQLSSDTAPMRPHMAKTERSEGRGIAAEAAAALSDVSGQIIDAPVHANLSGASGPPDDLTLLKGVGPKFAALLNGLGIVRFEQLARLSEGDIDRLDQNLGAFRGRLQRDQIPLQADYLARGDQDGFEQRFGKL